LCFFQYLGGEGKRKKRREEPVMPGHCYEFDGVDVIKEEGGGGRPRLWSKGGKEKGEESTRASSPLPSPSGGGGKKGTFPHKTSKKKKKKKRKERKGNRLCFLLLPSLADAGRKKEERSEPQLHSSQLVKKRVRREGK